MNSIEPIDALAFAFFREFARCEYCLKVVGLRDPNRKDPTADWGAFAAEVLLVFDTVQSIKLTDAINYYLTKPPKKQILQGEILAWEEVQPDHKSKAELVLRLVCRVRNNLFHGGKFNGQWFEPQRSEELLVHGLIILSAVVSAHSKVREAYAMKAA